LDAIYHISKNHIIILRILSNPYKKNQASSEYMTILAISSGEGWTKDMYESLRKEVNWEENPPPPQRRRYFKSTT
jgi:hypothetical protein